MTKTREQTHPPYHRILAVSFTGGFLDGNRLEFDDNLNCLIGGRGTGKTTVIETLRYALDRMPDEKSESERERERAGKIERLVQSNLKGGSLCVEIETMDQRRYTVSRGLGEEPLITNEHGERVEFSIGRDTVFGADFYSQNQIEEIADDAYFQLKLIDKFIVSEVEAVTREIKKRTKLLEDNARSILATRRRIADLADSIRELPDINERLQAFQVAGQGSEAETLRRESERRTERAKESQFVAHIFETFSGLSSKHEEILHEIEERFGDIVHTDAEAGPNRPLVERVRDTTRNAMSAARQSLRSARDELEELRSELDERHAQQDRHYRELRDKYEQEQVEGAERTRLQQRQTDLRDNERQLQRNMRQLDRLGEARERLREELSELRDQRFALRSDVAKRLTGRLAPMIRVRVEQFGNTSAYRSMLNDAMKGSRLKYRAIVERAVETIPPAELAWLVQEEDRDTLARQLDIEPDRAMRMIIQLKDKPEIFAIETVELHDRPIIELKDGKSYKDSASLSTGQKCTTILPILLMESERPLLVDQPEDNLDNAFVFETIVQSIQAVKKSRQLIFVTHNPNIPVLGDAGRVFALRSTGDAAKLVSAGSVDHVADEIMAILEGGKAAFEARQERYGRPAPHTKKS